MATDRKTITAELGRALHNKLFKEPAHRIYWAKEVLFDYYMGKPQIVDFMMFKQLNTTAGGIEAGEFSFFEVKSCKSDFDSLAAHTFFGERNYYVIPDTMVDYVTDRTRGLGNIGIYAGHFENGVCVSIKCVKPSRRSIRKRPAIELLFMMMRTLNAERGRLIEKYEPKKFDN